MNGFLVGPKFAYIVIIALLTAGIWVGTIQADLNSVEDNKADKVAIARQTEILISINVKLEDLKESVKDLDTRQRIISDDVAEFRVKAE